MQPRLSLVGAVTTATVLLSVASAQAAPITVNKTSDAAPSGSECMGVAGDCALRQAIDKANANPGSTVVVPNGTYRLTIAPAGPDDNSTGDLNVTASTTISGSGPSPIVEAGTSAGSGIDRVLTVGSGANVSISRITIRFGKSPGTGGGILDVGTLTLTDSRITQNTADSGGGIGFDDGGAASGALTVTGSTLTGNHSGDGGGIVEESGKSVTITDSSISNNTSSSLGGGVSQEGSASIDIERSTIHGNTATKEGGGLTQEAPAPVTISRSTIDGNTAGGYGGGIVEEGGDPSGAPADSLTNDTITNNHAVPPAAFNVGGGGIDLAGGGTAVIKNSTISKNTSTVSNGGNIHDDGTDPVDLTNTIVSGGTPANCQGGDIFSTGTHGHGSAAGRNLASDSSCGLGPAGADLVGVNPRLGPLANNGGPTQTMALLTGSPAINAASSCPPPAVDQRGVHRPQGGRCDIGAYEYKPPPPKACKHAKSKIDKSRSGYKNGVLTLHGTSSDKGCKGKSRIAKVTITVARNISTDQCRFLLADGHTFGPIRACDGKPPFAFKAKGTKKWSFKLVVNLPKGNYTIRSRAVDNAGTPQLVHHHGPNVLTLHLK